MVIKEAALDIIATRRSQYPDEGKPEFLLVGRSNVGKSSFINSILSRNNLAYISSKPGKTQTLNFYIINNSFYLIDVPGYGYANVDKKTQSKFGMMIEEYLEKRDELKADKVGGSKKEKNLKDILRAMDLAVGDDLVVFSSITKLGVKEVLQKIDDIIHE